MGLDHIHTIADEGKRDFMSKVLSIKQARAEGDINKLHAAYSYIYNNHHLFYNSQNLVAPELPRPNMDSPILRECNLK